MKGSVGRTKTVLKDVSVIIPVVDDHDQLRALLTDLNCAAFGQIIVACGDETTYDFIDSNKVLFIRTERGRGRQIQTAIERAECKWLWVLHADTRVSVNVLMVLCTQIPMISWGAFKVELIGKSRFLRVIGELINLRSRLTSIYTGDQGMFFKKDLLQQTEGFPPFDLLEDVECSRRLRRLERGVQLAAKLRVSARKWDHEGIFRTIVQMWLYRFLYFAGTEPNKLARRYYRRSEN